MKKIRLIFISIFSILLVSCGGGGSDSGGGSGTRVFSATGTFLVNGVGGPVSLTITVSGNTVSVTDGFDSGSGALNADGVNFSVPINLTSDPTVSCNAPLIVNGTINGQSISGTFSGSATCTVPGGTGRASFSGSYSGTQTSSSRALIGVGLAKSVAGAI